MKSQGLYTERFENPDCKCATYVGNLGPCREFEEGGNTRCVYCDHERECHPFWVDLAKEYVAECSYPGYEFAVITSKTTKAIYLQGAYYEPDTLEPQRPEKQFTRRWFLSPEMSKSEIVATVFKCVITSMEHRVREWFLYNGRAIYQPHYNVDDLHRICLERVERTVQK